MISTLALAVAGRIGFFGQTGYLWVFLGFVATVCDCGYSVQDSETGFTSIGRDRALGEYHLLDCGFDLLLVVSELRLWLELRST